MLNLPTTERTLDAFLQTYTNTNFLLTPDGVILAYGTCDNSFPETFSDSIPGKTIQDVFPSNLVEKLQHALQTVAQTRNAISLEHVLLTPHGKRWLDIQLIPALNSQVMLLTRDVTNCRETEIKMKRQVQQLSILRSIDLAIASGLDLKLLLSMLLDQVMALISADAATILLLNPRTNQLELATRKGFRSNILQPALIKLGEEYPGRVALERTLLHIPDIQLDQTAFARSTLFRLEGFITYWAVPLMMRGRVLGVLEMFHRFPFTPDSDLQDFLITAAGQAAVAVDSAKMFNELQRSNLELSLAYDAAIEGLSRALDLRNKESQEHNSRVAGITVNLAARLGVEQPDLVHIRRGAILHDVGKLAIPDQILFKPGPLAPEEWEVMRRHPAIAVELLSSVNYLEPVLEIPHWHHEKWDGTGYPDGLGGEEIPLAARIFALVDVYDALLSKRPFRSAWQKEEAVRYLKSESGKHFDPRILPEFLDLVMANSF